MVPGSELPINNIFLDTEYGVSNEERWEFVADLYPDVHPNRAGRYRFFYDVSLGDVGFGRKIGMMTEFYLSDKPEELERAVKTPVPEVLLKGMKPKRNIMNGRDAGWKIDCERKFSLCRTKCRISRGKGRKASWIT